MSRFKILLIPLACILIPSCNRAKHAPDSILTGQATISADEAIQPLLNAELDVFHSIYNQANIHCQFVSEYDAINLLLHEKIRLALVTRPLNQKELAYLKNKQLIPESILLGYDAIAVVVHSGNNTSALTTRQISGILTGEINNWSQIKESRLFGGIRLVFDTESSGIIRSLNDSLQLNSKISGDIQFAGNNSKLLEMVAADSNAIGFAGYNWLSEKESQIVQRNIGHLGLIAVTSAEKADSTNSFQPTVANLYNLRYPLMRRIYALYTDPSASLARGFLAHLSSERGQKIIYRMGLKPENDFQRLVNIKKDN